MYLNQLKVHYANVQKQKFTNNKTAQSKVKKNMHLNFFFIIFKKVSELMRFMQFLVFKQIKTDFFYTMSYGLTLVDEFT